MLLAFKLINLNTGEVQKVLELYFLLLFLPWQENIPRLKER